MNTQQLTLEKPRYAALFYGNGRIVFLLITALISLNIFLSNEFVYTRQLFYRTFGEQIAFERIQSFLDMRDKWSWISYAIVPLVLLIKVSYVALCIDIGLLFSKHEAPISFKKLFRIALMAEIAFVLANFLKTGWLYFIDMQTLHDARYFFPLSLGFMMEGMPQWLAYPLLTANLFEIIFILLVAMGLNMYLGKGYRKALTVTLLSYGTGLLLWAVLVVFFSINLT